MSIRLDPTDPLSTLLTMDQAAAVAQVTRRTVERWVASGLVHPYRAHGRVYVTERAVLDAEAQGWVRARQGRPGARVATCLLT